MARARHITGRIFREGDIHLPLELGGVRVRRRPSVWLLEVLASNMAVVADWKRGWPLAAMAARGWVVRDAELEASHGEGRKVYVITEAGREVAAWLYRRKHRLRNRACLPRRQWSKAGDPLPRRHRQHAREAHPPAGDPASGGD